MSGYPKYEMLPFTENSDGGPESAVALKICLSESAYQGDLPVGRHFVSARVGCETHEIHASRYGTAVTAERAPLHDMASRLALFSFEQRGDAGSRVSLDIEFEFEGRFMDKMLGPFFEDICNKLVNAFTQRAAAIYS